MEDEQRVEGSDSVGGDGGFPALTTFGDVAVWDTRRGAWLETKALTCREGVSAPEPRYAHLGLVEQTRNGTGETAKSSLIVMGGQDVNNTCKLAVERDQTHIKRLKPPPGQIYSRSRCSIWMKCAGFGLSPGQNHQEHTALFCALHELHRSRPSTLGLVRPLRTRTSRGRALMFPRLSCSSPITTSPSEPLTIILACTRS
jgi:hypothetical protein